MTGTTGEIAALRRETAALWCLREADGELDAAGHAALDEWVTADPDNAAAFADARGVWSDAAAAADAPEMIRLRARAVAMLRDGEARRRPGWRAFAAGLAACLALLLLAGLLWHGRAESYRTAPGERRVVVLADGTRVTLDGATRVDVRLERDRRRLTLVAGRAKFDVAHDALRPLSVAAGNRLTVATGTSFSVELLRHELHVVLYQGRVEVMDAARDAGALATGTPVAALTPGHELIAAIDRPGSRIARADRDRSLSWENGLLTFVDEPLGVAVERMNRGATRRLILTDAAAARLRISGTFAEGDTTAFVEGVAALYPVQVAERADGIVLRRRGAIGENAPPGV